MLLYLPYLAVINQNIFKITKLFEIIEKVSVIYFWITVLYLWQKMVYFLENSYFKKWFVDCLIYFLKINVYVK